MNRRALVTVLAALAGPALADATPAPAPSNRAPSTPSAPLRSPSNLDRIYFTIGPVGGAVHVAGDWHSAVGLEASLVRVREHELPAALGVDVGGISYGGRAGGRLWLEGEVAFHGPVAVGLSVGMAAEVDPVEPPRLGAQGTLWLFAGIIPYVRAGAVEQTGAFVEAGAMIKLPINWWW